MPYFMTRPVDYFHAMQWTGDNYTELVDWAEVNAPWALPMSEPDSNDTISLNPASERILMVNNWLADRGVLPDSVMQGEMQTLSGVPPFSWDITGT